MEEDLRTLFENGGFILKENIYESKVQMGVVKCKQNKIQVLLLGRQAACSCFGPGVPGEAAPRKAEPNPNGNALKPGRYLRPWPSCLWHCSL